MNGKPSIVRRIALYLFLVILGSSLGRLVAYLLLRPEQPPQEQPVRLPDSCDHERMVSWSSRFVCH